MPTGSGDSKPETELTVQEFVELHKPQLTSSGVPERFWSTLHHKLKSEEYDAGDCFQIILEEIASDDDDATETIDHRWKVVVYTENGIQHSDDKHIYLIDHAWTYHVRDARKNLEEIPGLLDRMAALMEVDGSKTMDEKVERVLHEMWRFNQTYSLGNFEKGSDESLPVWYIMDEFGSRVQHGEEPAVRMVPFMYAPKQLAFTLMWPVRDLEHGDEVTRNYVESMYDADVRKAKLLPWVHTDMTYIDYQHKEPELSYFTQLDTLPTLTVDFPPLPRDRVLKVFVDYGQYFSEHLTDPRFEVVESMSDADIIWTRRHFNDFKSLSEEFPERKINQFPYEMVITVKDLLAIVARRVGSAVKRSGDPSQDLDSRPAWLPVTYNLMTELPQFVSYFQHREARGMDNHFICKPWDLARSLDTHITNSLDYIVRLPDTGPKIVSKYMENPVLLWREDISADVKFDVRYMVLLASVQPLKLYVYEVFWVRFANRPFSLDHFDDYEKHFTVMNYSEESNLKQIHYDEFITLFERQYSDHSWKNVQEDIFKMFRELFQAAISEPPPKGIGHSPQSRAIYGVDLILKWETNSRGERHIQPMILECNFSADCQRACQYHPFFVNDVFSTLFLDDADGKHVIPLL